MLRKVAEACWKSLVSDGRRTRAARRYRVSDRGGAAVLLEILEDRLVPAGTAGGATTLLPIHHPSQVAPAATSSTAGYQPNQVRTAYGINGITFGSVQGDGAGQAIAIVDMYNDPNIAADVDTFDRAMALAAGSSQSLYQQYGAASSWLTVYNQNGQVINPGSISVPVDSTGGWEGEEALDVEWAHAVAPGAKIYLVECSTTAPNGANPLFVGTAAAAALPGVSVVSMSWSLASSQGTPTENSGETSFDSYFTTPSGHQGVTFLGSTGDSGAPGGYPAYSPNVVAVGGTSLTLSATGAYQGETAWSGSGGGVSLYEAEPAYQKAVQSTGKRTAPDVAFVADPNTGVAVYDSYNAPGWEQIGGTSLSAPSWAGLIAIANQGRGLNGLATLNSTSPTQTLTALYGLPSADFHDIQSGSNGSYTAGPGYDEVTGLGSPLANLVVPALAGYGAATTAPAPDHLVVTAQPSGSVTTGQTFSLTVVAENASNAVDTGFTGTVTLTLANNPGNGTLGGTLTASAVNGVATFSNLTINNPGSGYTIQAASSGLTGVTSGPITVTAPPAPTLTSVGFVLLSSGQFQEHSGSTWTTLATGIATVSNQGIDNSGQVMVDVITTAGTAYEYHNGSGWVTLAGSAASAAAGRGVSYVLLTNGNLYEYWDGTAQFTFLTGGVTSISAGTDTGGGNAVDVVLSSGNAWAYSDSSGWQFIASGVRSVSAGQQGNVDFVTTAGNAYYFSMASGASTFLASNVSQVTSGTDAKGNLVIDLLFSGGVLDQYTSAGGWAQVATGVQSISKARAGVLDAIFSSGSAYEDGTGGAWTYLTGSARLAV